jgi:hypothetical protein
MAGSVKRPLDASGRMNEHRDFLPQMETAVPIIHPPGGGRVVGVLRDQSTFKVLSEQTGGAYAILEQRIPAGHGPPLHVHRHETEIFYILDGGNHRRPEGVGPGGGDCGRAARHPAHLPQCRIGRRRAPAADSYPRTLCQLFHRRRWRAGWRPRGDSGTQRQIRCRYPVMRRGSGAMCERLTAGKHTPERSRRPSGSCSTGSQRNRSSGAST